MAMKEKLECRVGADDGSPVGDVRHDPVDIDRCPQKIMHRLPFIAVENTREIHPRRAHHEGNPGITHEHQGGTRGIQ